MQTVASILEIQKPVPFSVSASESVCSAIARMNQLGVKTVPVVDGANGVVGVFSGHDVLVRIVAAERDPHGVTVREVMSRENVSTIVPTATLEAAMEVMVKCCRDELVVVDQGMVYGMISIADISRALVRERDARIHDLTYYITHG